MIEAIYTFLIKIVYNRHNKAELQKSTEIVDIPLQKFNKRLRSSRRYRVFKSRNRIFQVQILDTGVKYIVNLETTKCNCSFFWDYCLPCTYTITALRHETKDLYLYFHKGYKVKALQKTYKRFIIPFSIQDLLIAVSCYPLVYKKQPRQPKTKRIRRGLSKRKPTTCGNCGQKAKHNARTCRSAPKHIQREKEHNLSSSNSDSSSSINSTKDDSSDQGSLDLELLQEQQWQAEMDRYDFVIAQAQEIVERQRQEEIEDNNIQSDELSVPASSIFDGIGMEMDIDNTSEGTSDGDKDSDSDEDGNGDKDSDGDEGGNREGNSNGIVGIISPWRTRSRRIR
jgi:hypothetical protein